uniref:TPT domain-containing protein n=1 Tax=Panagrellus redivivus TaxID=6233 RepID=A0A7E4W5A9_PANRE
MGFMNNHQHSEYWFACRVILICCGWYAVSSGQSIINKWTLSHYPYPLTVTLSSLVNNAIFAIPLARITHVRSKPVSSTYLLRTIVPIASCRSIALASAFFGLWKVPVSYAQTVKATLPVFTVLATRFMNHEPQPAVVYASLVPIVVGVVTASLTEVSFDLIGLLASLFSVFLHAFINVLIKKVFDDTGMHPIALLCLSSKIAAIVLFPLWLLQDGRILLSQFIYGSTDETLPLPDLRFIGLLGLAGLTSFGQNLCAFLLIHQLTALSYAVASATKRVAVIVLSLFIFQNPVSLVNCLGMALAMVGMFAYNRAKDKGHGTKLLRKRDSGPLTAMTSSNSDARLMLSVN